MVTMKTKYYILLPLMALGLTGCKDFFEPESPSSIELEYVYADPARIESPMLGVYRVFGEQNSFRARLACGYQGLNTDIEMSHKTGADDVAVTTYSLSTSNGRIANPGKGPWNYFNTGVERCNTIIDGINDYGDLNDEDYRYYLGEALTMRAFIMFEMVKYWGDIPPRFESLAKNPDGAKITKNDRNIVYEQLRSDLKYAAELLPWSAACPGNKNNTTERANKALALGLLARMDLMYAGYAMRPDYIQVGGGAPYSVQLNVKDVEKRRELYSEAMWACEQIIAQEDDFKFFDDFEAVFRDICADNTNYATSEVIWAIPFGNSRGQFMNYNCIKASDVLKALKNNESGSTNAVQTVLPILYYDYDAKDKRRDVTIANFMWSIDQMSDADIRLPGEAKTGKLYQKMQDIATLYLGKYRVEWMSRTRNGDDEGVNFPILRYTDVMLMFCEASLGGITGDVPQYAGSISAQTLFDRVRTRAGLESKPLNMENLMEERKFEFCGEYIRKYDLQRWGKLKESLVKTTKRLENFVLHLDEFSQLSDTIWYKYRRLSEADAADYLYQGEGAKADAVYVIDSIWGLNKGENAKPEFYNSKNGWMSKNRYFKDSKRIEVSGSFKLYQQEDMIDSRQLWPIFVNDLAGSDGTLWNDYGY